MDSYKVTVLAENTTYRHNVIAQHGQSILIEHKDYKLLFDVGEIPGGVTHNLTQQGIGLEQINDIVISHRHIDHIGALPAMLPGLDKQRLFLPEQMGEAHIKKHPEKYRFLEAISEGDYNLAIDPKTTETILKYAGSQVVRDQGFEIAHSIYTTGSVGDWMKEQAIVIDQKERGITVIAGCSHPTVEVLVEKAIEVTGNQKVRGIIGGMHYTDFSEEEMHQRAEKLKDYNLDFVFPSHCTTVKGSLVLQEVLGEDIVCISKTYTLGAGNSLEIGETVKKFFV